MDFGDPSRAITPTLDGPVLAALAAAGRAMTVGEVARHTVRGSELGARKCLARLVDQGIVTVTEIGRLRVYELNRAHVGAEIAVGLAGLRPAFFDRIRAELRKWKPPPHYACVFGSAARGDGDVHSDVDVLLVHVPFPGDPKPPRLRDSVGKLVGGPAAATASAAKRWRGLVDALSENIQAWTGNWAHVVDISWAEWLARKDGEGVFSDIRRDAIDVTPRVPFRVSLPFVDGGTV